MNEINTPTEESPRPSGMHRLRDQLPTVIMTAILVIGAGAFMYRASANRQMAALAPLREENEALRTQADENRRQIEAATQLIREAIGKREGEVFKTDEEIQKLNGDRINALADAIAQKVTPALPGPKTPEELAKAEDEQVDKISSRIVDKMQPSLSTIGQQEQNLTNMANKTAAHDAVRIENLNANLQATQAAAQDALKLSQQVSAMYLDSFKDHGVLVRVLALPTDIIRDAAGGNFVTGRDRKQAQQDIDTKMHEIETRLDQIRSQTSAPVAAAD